MRPLFTALVGASLATVTTEVRATPRPLPFTYNYDTNPEGEGEIETYVDLVPVKAADATGQRRTALLSQFQEEFEYGITNRLELGLYVTFAPTPSGFGGSSVVPSLTEGNGSKQRLRYRISDSGVLPIDIGLYGEVTENENEIELEAKVILQRRFGKLYLAANLVVEQESYFTGELSVVLDPSAGLWYQVTPVFQPGIEWWMYKELSNRAPPGGEFNLDAQHYVGPTMLMNFGRVWWTTGAYARLTELHHDLNPNAGDSFGQLWFRTVIGVNL